jgi:hypothetical protein
MKVENASLAVENKIPLSKAITGKMAANTHSVNPPQTMIRIIWIKKLVTDLYVGNALTNT